MVALMLPTKLGGRRVSVVADSADYFCVVEKNEERTIATSRGSRRGLEQRRNLGGGGNGSAVDGGKVGKKKRKQGGGVGCWISQWAT